jgi:hypothetical protein
MPAGRPVEEQATVAFGRKHGDGGGVQRDDAVTGLALRGFPLDRTAGGGDLLGDGEFGPSNWASASSTPTASRGARRGRQSGATADTGPDRAPPRGPERPPSAPASTPSPARVSHRCPASGPPADRSTPASGPAAHPRGCRVEAICADYGALTAGSILAWPI